ncbi:hypothetical protein P22_3904 [Propionispora sp. 2/2-37]|uniref:Ger(x)C family spore germination protein n=1 Tax=Propionispora sp. 2/2-37 TaxID=1677858 RepID=UPI0006BB68BA|nr:Ger(x)C family spore germination protein [Propionispora sp. 2/2-37]CUH97760.1 hypothetical protein P22_3904 [Propionispora sp. 2/2-37]
MKRLILFVLIGILLFFTTGCGAKSEIENLGIVVAMGIDTTPAGNYLLSLQILKAQRESAGGMGGQKGGKPATPSDVEFLTVSGDTIYSALDNLSTQLGKKIHLSHINFVVISEKVAKSGVASIIDAGIRSHQFRTNRPILVTKGEAAKIISAVPPEDPIPANAVKNILAQQERYGYSAIVTYLDFANSLASKTASPIAGVIDLSKTEQGDEVLKVEGIAVFSKDKLIGYLDGEETRGMQWLKGKVKDGSIVIASPDNGKITLRVTQANSRIKPVIHHNKPAIQATIKADGYLRSMKGQLDPMKEPDILNALDELQNALIKKEINQALYAAQKKFKADIFEFGDAIHRDYPEQWKNIEESWNEVFPDLDIEVKVDSHIHRPGMISKPLY